MALKAPFPYFGGKSKAAPVVWSALGDVHHYVEPFAGSLAVLLNRPHEANRPYYSETVNDADGFIINTWRSIQLSPEETAFHASNPVFEADLHARHVEIVRWRELGQINHLAGDPLFHDPKIAGWWLWGMACWIGSGFASGKGPWWPDENGFLVKRKSKPGVSRQLPHLGNNGRGVNNAEWREHGTEYHGVVMPKLLAWFQALSARLRHVRICNGDWRRVVTSGAAETLSIRSKGVVGIFLDPPYGDVRADGLYTFDSLDIAKEVQEYALSVGDNPKYRVVLAGFDTEHSVLCEHGWTEVEWFQKGFLTGGMGNTKKKGTHQQKRERLWLSPHCLKADKPAEEIPANDSEQVDTRQIDMFGVCK